MTYLGDFTAIIDRSDDVEGPEGTLTGKTAWLLWRSAYLYKSLSIRNQVALVYVRPRPPLRLVPRDTDTPSLERADQVFSFLAPPQHWLCTWIAGRRISRF